MGIVVPPGGFAGYAQMTPASQRAISPMERAVRRSSRRQGVKIGSRKRRSSKKRKSASKSGSRAARKPKFGSPAWHKKYKTGKHRRKK